MRRKIVITLLVILCFILQCTVLKSLALGGISPNLMLIIVSAYAFMRGEKEGMIVGFFSGLLTDIFFGQLFGFYALLYMLLGYGNGLFHRMFYDDDIKLPLVMVGVTDLLYGLCVYFFMFLLRSKFDFPYYLWQVILPELVYTVALTLVAYRLIRRLNHFLETKEADPETRYSILSSGGGIPETEEELE